MNELRYIALSRGYSACPRGCDMLTCHEAGKGSEPLVEKQKQYSVITF